MRKSKKPIRECHSCLLNLGRTCWGFSCPRDQWGGRKRCRAFENEAAYEMFRRWSEDAQVKTRKQLRQEFHRKKKTVFERGHFLDGISLKT